MTTYICDTCGNEFEKIGQNQKRCTPCAQIVNREYRRAYNAAKHVNGPGSGSNQFRENNPNWRGKGTRFMQYKIASLTKPYLCERCHTDLTEYIEEGGRNGMWCVHHIDRDRTNCALQNLELLCKSCHQKEHEVHKNFLAKG